ncbi:MAG: hypothetical protein HKP38_07130, partial [Croceitalea sp.]|nr:hypothetical protein [Croceitalea sp.]
MRNLTFILVMALTNSFAQKEIPQSILKEAKVALSFYPQLENVPIVFKFKKNIKKSTMQAQPIFSSLFTTRKKRRYVVLISERFKIAETTFLTKDIPEDIMIGWLGHE